MLLNITYNFGNHRTVTKRLDFLGHAEYILRLSADELKVAELLFYHEPDKDELFAIQNLRGHVRSLQNRNAEAEADSDYAPPPRDSSGIGKSDWRIQSTPRDSSEPIFLFLDEVGDMPENVRAAIREIGDSLRIREDNDEDSGGGECMCDWEYRTRCTCGFEDNNDDCGGCGESVRFCGCDLFFPAQKPYEADTNLLANADYFRKLARERVLSDLNNTFADMIEKGDGQICDVFYSWVVNVLREKGYDMQVLEEWQCSEELYEKASLENKVPAIIFLTGRD